MIWCAQICLASTRYRISPRLANDRHRVLPHIMGSLPTQHTSACKHQQSGARQTMRAAAWQRADSQRGRFAPSPCNSACASDRPTARLDVSAHQPASLERRQLLQRAAASMLCAPFAAILQPLSASAAAVLESTSPPADASPADFETFTAKGGFSLLRPRNAGWITAFVRHMPHTPELGQGTAGCSGSQQSRMACNCRCCRTGIRARGGRR